jgi:hypothetical protein
MASLSPRGRASQPAEQHRHELRPAGEAFGVTFHSVSGHQPGKLVTRECPKKLIEKTSNV